MTECPECGSHSYIITDSEDKSSYYGIVETTYYCEECDCEWIETEEITIDIEVIKHGKEYEDVSE